MNTIVGRAGLAQSEMGIVAQTKVCRRLRAKILVVMPKEAGGDHVASLDD